jgi:HK97 gp10 family phage protein
LQYALEQKVKADAKAAVKSALLAGGTIFKDAVVANAPKDTGFLEEHFDLKLSFRGSDGTSGTAYVGPQGKVDYPDKDGGWRTKLNRRGKKYKVGRIPVATVARFLELGTSKMRARPFMSQAFESVKSSVMDAVIAKLREVLKLS